MPQREFLDSHGRTWTVWDVLPSRVAQDLDAAWRARQEREASPGSAVADLPERSRSTFPGQFAEGWLCFDSSGERRRLAPVPTGWEHLGASELDALRGRATPVGTRAAPSPSISPEPARVR